MKLDSKYFDRIRFRRRGQVGSVEHPSQRICAQPGCTAPATHRAPKGRGQEGEYYYFCLEHVRDYNKAYNYFDGMSDEAVSAFQTSAATGHRPTWRMGLNGHTGEARRESDGGLEGRGSGFRVPPEESWRGQFSDPFSLFGDRPAGAEGAAEPPSASQRVTLIERQALENLGLELSASAKAIKARYKDLVKRHHPDANKGDRSSETRLRSIIQAYQTLRRAGRC